MFEEIKSDYIYKYDVAKLIVEDILHITMKSVSYEAKNQSYHSASARIAIQFLESLERQFPIEQTNQQISLISASDFASKLNVHVNHLNKSVKAVTGKTTTSIIKERISQEAKRRES